jgi:hypothetical protein
VPASGSTVIEQLRDAGLEIDGALADEDPIVAVSEVWDPRTYDEIVVCTLPIPVSRWLHLGLPQRIAELTGAPVTHVIAHPTPPPVETTPAPSHSKPLLGALSVLGWGGPAGERH